MNISIEDQWAFNSVADAYLAGSKRQVLVNSKPEPKARVSRLGLPEFKWSMGLLGLCVYSFAVISFRLPVAQLGIVLGVVGLFSGKYPLRTPGPFWIYFAFLVWATLSSVISPFASVAIDAVTDRYKLLVVFLLILNVLRTEGQLRFYLLFVLACFVFFPARGTIVGGNHLGGRVVWNFIYSNSNYLASLCLLALGIAIAFIATETNLTFLRISACFSAAILLVVILRTQSRGAFLGLIAMTAPALIPMMIKQLRLAIAIIIAVVLVISFAVPPEAWDRLLGSKKMTQVESIQGMEGTAGMNEADASSAERLAVLKAAWQIFLDNSVFGTGLGTYAYVNAIYLPGIGKMDTHNTYLNLAAETGLPGLLIWLTLAGSVLSYARRTRSRATESILKVQTYWLEQTIIGFLVASVFGSFSSLNFPYMMLGILWSSASLLANSPQSTKPYANIRRI